MDRMTKEDFACVLSSTFSITSLSLHVVVCMATIFGNGIVLVSIYKYPKQFKGSLYMFIGNLAVSDLVMGLWLLLFIFEEIVREMQENWYFCVAKSIGILVSYCCSIFSLLGMSLDRFLAVMYPLKHLRLIKSHNRKCFIFSFTAMWIVSIIVASVPVIIPNLTPSHTIICRLGFILPRSLEFTCVIALFLVAIVNFSLYGIVMRKTSGRETPGNSNGRVNQTKTVLMIIVLAVFVICWLPFTVCSLLMQFDLAPTTFAKIFCAHEYLAKLGFVNSALNWVVYGLANRKFRMAFRKILFCN